MFCVFLRIEGRAPNSVFVVQSTGWYGTGGMEQMAGQFPSLQPTPIISISDPNTLT